MGRTRTAEPALIAMLTVRQFKSVTITFCHYFRSHSIKPVDLGARVATSQVSSPARMRWTANASPTCARGFVSLKESTHNARTCWLAAEAIG